MSMEFKEGEIVRYFGAKATINKIMLKTGLTVCLITLIEPIEYESKTKARFYKQEGSRVVCSSNYLTKVDNE